MAEKYTIGDVTKDLRAITRLVWMMDTDPEGFWTNRENGERNKIGLEDGEPGKEIVLFQDPLPRGDYLYFNPFSEGLGTESMAVKVFYSGIRATLNAYIAKVVRYIVATADAHKKALVAKEEHKLSHAFTRIVSTMVDKKTNVFDSLDHTSVKEFETMLLRIDEEIVAIPYRRNITTANLMCSVLTSKDWDEKYGVDIRKKSIAAFKGLLMGILGISSTDELESLSSKYTIDMKSAAKLHTTLTVLSLTYSRFADIIAEAVEGEGKAADLMEVDLESLNNVIERLPFAYAIAKHMIQPVIPKSSPTDTGTINTLGQTVPPWNNTQQTLADGSRRFSPKPADNRFPGMPTPPVGGVAGARSFAPVRAEPSFLGGYGNAPGHQQRVASYGQPTNYGFGGNQQYGQPQQGFGYGFGQPEPQVDPFSFTGQVRAPGGFGQPETTKRYFG